MISIKDENCLIKTEEFLEWVDEGAVTGYDGFGKIYDGINFIEDANVFDFIAEAAKTMTREEFISKYPYVAWYNK